MHRDTGPIAAPWWDDGTAHGGPLPAYREAMPATQPGRFGRLGRAATALLLATVAIVMFSGAALAATPSDSGTAAPPRLPWMRNLVTPGAYVGQYNYVQCVAASIQMMHNMINGEANHSAATQHTLWLQSRALSEYTGDGGADPYGWSRDLTVGGSHYQIYAGTSLADTLHDLARMMAESGRPAGITVYSGGHAWVISGLNATNNPALTDDFTVTSVAVLDPLWALTNGGSGTVAPGTWLTVAQLKSKFTPYHDPRRAPSIEGRYVAIVPVPTAAELANPANNRQVFSYGLTGPSLIGSHRTGGKP